MNFKGTTNIPRDQVKGIIEEYGGSWNGYTWIDQTTYLETATRDALDRMLFIESERMARCLYHPDDVESVKDSPAPRRYASCDASRICCIASKRACTFCRRSIQPVTGRAPGTRRAARGRPTR